jgi:ATP-dependent 26S proteasome regulatory subunit
MFTFKGPGGTGKTFVYRAVYYAITALGGKVSQFLIEMFILSGTIFIFEGHDLSSNYPE